MKTIICIFSFLFCCTVVNAQNIATKIDYESIPDNDGTFIVLSVSGSPGTITNAEDLMICTYIEHEHPGDISVKVHCPNMQNVTLLGENQAGNSVFFNPDSDYLNQGEYFWTSDQNFPYIAEVATGTNIVPMGTYRSSESFDGLIGCPINGPWVLEIIDATNEGNGSSSVFGLKFFTEFEEDWNNWAYDILFGCIDSTACNYNPFVWMDLFNETCYHGSGCTDLNASNYDPEAECDNGMCLYLILGCTDETATNFNPEANFDDGSCQYLSGCTEEDACNYNPEAVIDDESCEYNSCASCSEEWVSSDFLCDTTVIYINIENITPEGSVFNIYQSMNQETLLLSFSEEGSYSVAFTTNGESILVDTLPLFVSAPPFTEPEVWLDTYTEYEFWVIATPEQPIVTDNGNGTFECTNCNQDVDELAWILNWDDSPLEEIILDSTTINVSDDFSGTVKVCLGNADCYSCSLDFQVVGLEEEDYTPNLQIFSNGAKPILVPNENGDLSIYDSTGRLVYKNNVSKGQKVETNLISGIYQIVFNIEHYQISSD
jgi:subtilisin-like proprotein convertase family protein